MPHHGGPDAQPTPLGLTQAEGHVRVTAFLLKSTSSRIPNLFPHQAPFL